MRAPPPAAKLAGCDDDGGASTRTTWRSGAWTSRLAVGGGAGRRLARAAVVRPVAATAVGMLRLGWQLAARRGRSPAAGRPGHPRASGSGPAGARPRDALRGAPAPGRGARAGGDRPHRAGPRPRRPGRARRGPRRRRRDRAGRRGRRRSPGPTWMPLVGQVDLDAVAARVDLDADPGAGRPRRHRRPRRPRRRRRPRRPRRDLPRVDLERGRAPASTSTRSSRASTSTRSPSRVDLDAILAPRRPQRGRLARRPRRDPAADRTRRPRRAGGRGGGTRPAGPRGHRPPGHRRDRPPGILRQSSGAVSSQAARVVRTEGMHADDSVARFVDRMLRRSAPRPLTP